MDCPGNLKPVCTDPNRLAQILSTLVERCIGWSPGGTVRIAVHRLRRAGERDSLEIEVADNGTGLCAA